MAKKRVAIVCDGSAWFVRRVRVIEEDMTDGEKVYRCDKHLGGPYKSLADVPQVKRSLAAAKRRG